MAKRRFVLFGMFGLGLGYFLWYSPYSALAKGVSGGLLPGIDRPVGGLVLLPATVLGQLVAMPVFVLASGWWRYAGRRTIAGREIPFPARHTLESAFWMSLIVGSTTLNFTFPNASIVFMLILMRISTLLIAPGMDIVRRRKIHWYSAAAVVVALTSAAIALTDIDNYTLTAGAVLSLALYAVGYANRFRIMGVHAKKGDPLIDRRYLIEEHMATPVVLLLLVAIPALVGLGSWMQALRTGFAWIVAEPAVSLPAMLIGVCYEGLFIMTTLIYLDRREFSFGMPVHVSSSLLAGVVSSIGLYALFGAALPSPAQYVAASMAILVAILLSYPALMARLRVRRARRTLRDELLFVCGGNTSRSPMAAAIATAEIAADPSLPPWRAESAGLSVRTPGAPLSREAAAALAELRIDQPPEHRSRQLTREICAGTQAVYCMTRTQRDQVVAMAPEAAERVFCLDSDADLPDPAGQPLESYRACVARLRPLVRERLREQRERYALSGAEFG
ncbi:hypothetical protein GCM10022419_118430 [Nonomuraea rosea]|uniref:Phosphotyrosine protein phosphatase I domain-containing protein n=1 Tax=Nonomuraea rosea TaxID=638574 RepID=A0ABP6ZMR6_9ACTN